MGAQASWPGSHTHDYKRGHQKTLLNVITYKWQDGEVITAITKISLLRATGIELVAQSC